VKALDCSCGQHLEADNVEELFERTREHVDSEHPEMELSDEKVRQIVDRGAYEK
jgi:predicted small metal-binding protein